jgi:hypothetical protein
VPAERDLEAGREPAEGPSTSLLEQERGLRVVHLRRHRLQRLCRDVARKQADGGGVPGEAPVGEGIHRPDRNVHPRNLATIAGMSAAESYRRLLAHLAEAQTLASCASALEWDQETAMPPKAVAFRAEEMGSWRGWCTSASPTLRSAHGCRLRGRPRSGADGDAAANLRELRRDFERATRLPSSLVAEMSETSSRAMEVWKEARQKSDFALFSPWLHKQIALPPPGGGLLRNARGRRALRRPARGVRAGNAQHRAGADLRAPPGGHRVPPGAHRGSPAEARHRAAAGALPRPRAARLQPFHRGQAGIRLRGRPPGRVGAPVHVRHGPRRHAHHHPLHGGPLPGRAELDDARGGTRALRAGASQERALGAAALGGLLAGGPREPVAPVGEPGGALARLLGVGPSRGAPPSGRGTWTGMGWTRSWDAPTPWRRA